MEKWLIRRSKNQDGEVILLKTPDGKIFGSFTDHKSLTAQKSLDHLAQTKGFEYEEEAA